MSSRTESLYKQLDVLQPQLEKILIESLEQEVRGEYSRFISSILGNEGRFYQKLQPEMEKAKDLANQLIKLKEKLGEPLNEGATGVLLAYSELKQTKHYIYGAERADFAKEQLRKLGVHNPALQEPTPGGSKPKDSISKPAKGRYFPISISEALAQVNQLIFKHSEYSSRIAISLVNPDADSDLGTKVAAFYPSADLILFSFPETFPLARAKTLTIAAVKEFCSIDKKVTYSWSRQQSTSYRAYLSVDNQLVVTPRERAIKQAKYRSTDKFSSSCSPKNIKTDEVVLKQIEVL